MWLSGVANTDASTLGQVVSESLQPSKFVRQDIPNDVYLIIMAWSVMLLSLIYGTIFFFTGCSKNNG